MVPFTYFILYTQYLSLIIFHLNFQFLACASPHLPSLSPCLHVDRNSGSGCHVSVCTHLDQFQDLRGQNLHTANIDVENYIYMIKIFFQTSIFRIFGSDRSSRSHSVCLSVCPAQSVQEHHICIFLAQIFKQSVRNKSEVNEQSVSTQRAFREQSVSTQRALKEQSENNQ